MKPTSWWRGPGGRSQGEGQSPLWMKCSSSPGQEIIRNKEVKYHIIQHEENQPVKEQKNGDNKTNLLHGVQDSILVGSREQGGGISSLKLINSFWRLYCIEVQGIFLWFKVKSLYKPRYHKQGQGSWQRRVWTLLCWSFWSGWKGFSQPSLALKSDHRFTNTDTLLSQHREYLTYGRLGTFYWDCIIRWNID